MPTENRSCNTEMVSELLPCPFCGQQDFLIERLDSDASVVICQGLTGPHEACLARGPVGVAQNEGEDQPGRDKAVELWNARAEQHQGEPVACAHEWTDDGQFMLVCTACGAQEDHDPKWRDMATAPRDGTLVRLLVEFTEHATEDSDAMPSPTIGANSFDHTGEDAWQFAGWSWEQDCFTQGAGEPVGWLPLLDTPHATPGEVERLRIALGNTQALLDQANHHKAQRGETIDTLRADVETMRRKNNEYWHETEVLRAHLGEAEAGCMRLRAQLAERDALLTRALPYLSNTPDLVQHGAEDLAEEIRSASAGRPCYGPNEWGTECGKCSKCKSASAEPSAPVDIDERAKFEAEWRKRYPDHPPLALKRSGPDLADYYNTRTKDAWWAWQARAALERKT